MNSTENYQNSFCLQVVDKISAMIAYWDKDLICRFANAAYLDWFGKTGDEMINKMHIKDLLGPMFELNLPYISEALNGNVQTFEREIHTHDGGIRYSLANYYPNIENGEIKGFFVHVADVSPLKILEKKLIETNAKSNEQNRRLLNFSNIVSHNLKSYAGNMSSILDLYTLSNTESKKNQMINFLREISNGFTSTVNDLNKISSIQNDEEIHLEKVHLYDYVQKAQQILHIQIESLEIRIKNNVDMDVEVLINPAYMESIVLNLLSNAIKYKHPDREANIEIYNFFEGNKLGMAIKDNGLGINLEKHGSSIFGMYKTFHSNKNAQGIGLFITKYQIEKMGGEIQVESEVNVGSTFKIYFSSL